MEYPAHLIPQLYFTLIDTADVPDGAVFLRRVRTSRGMIPVDEFGEIPASVFLGSDSVSRMNGLSVNMQGIYTVQDIPFRAVYLSDGSSPDAIWKPGDWTPIVEDVVCEYLPESGAVHLPFSWWQSRRFPTKDEFNLPGLQKMSGRTVWTHCPTVTNFWHFELRFTVVSGEPIKTSKSRWKRKAFEFVLRDALSSGDVAVTTKNIPYEKILQSAYTPAI